MKIGRLTGFESLLARRSPITYALEQIADRRQFIFSFGGVHIVGNGDKPDVMIGKKVFREFSNLNIVSAKARHIFYENSRRMAFLKFLNHRHKTGPLHCDTGNAIVREMDKVGISFFFGNLD